MAEKQLAQIWREEITSLSSYMYVYAHELYLTAVGTLAAPCSTTEMFPENEVS